MSEYQDAPDWTPPDYFGRTEFEIKCLERYLEFQRAKIGEINPIQRELETIRDLACMTNSAHVLYYLDKRLEELK